MFRFNKCAQELNPSNVQSGVSRGDEKPMRYAQALL
jgi:hypothetical protein